MAAVWLVLGVLIGAGIVLLALRGRLRALGADAARAVALERELDGAQREVGHERALAEQRLAAVQDAETRLSDTFKALSVEALQSNMAQLAELARAQLQVTQTEARGDLDRRRDQVEQLVAPVREQLGKVDEQLRTLDRERRASHVRLESQLRALGEHGERLRTETSALVTALRRPNTRGQWGQMQLRNVVEAAGMLRHCDFAEQSSYAGDEVTHRPDMVVNLPGGKHVIVDAKAPLQGVLDAYEARDEPAREAAMRDHARLLRKHVRQLSDKDYSSAVDSSPDLVVMFLPGEHLYSAALEVDPSLLEDAMARRVLIATPTILLALLHSVAYGWQQERVAESAQAISALGRELHGRIVKLSTLLARLGDRLGATVKTYNETIGSYEARVIPGARKLAEHGAVAENAELPALAPVEAAPRSVQSGELRLDVGTGRTEDEIRPRRLRAAD